MLKLLIAGDYYPNGVISEMIESRDYSFFSQVQEECNKSDYSILNFESPVVNSDAPPIHKNGPCIKCSEAAMEAIKYAGFNCVTLANNHFYDYGEKGVADTLEACAKHGIDFVGGGKNLEEAKRPLMKDLNGVKLSIVNICENEFSIAKDDHGGSAPLNVVDNFYQIKDAKEKSDFVVMIIHGGTEGYQLPTPRMQETYRCFIDMGADVVINHHQHCYSGYEIYKGKPIFYGLGNFCFPQDVGESTPQWEEGYMVKLLIEDNIRFELIPYVQCGKETCVSIVKEKSFFEGKIKKLNEIICDKDKLKQYFEEMCLKTNRLLAIEPIQNRYIRSLQLRNWLPSFLRNRQLLQISNYINCESHLDILKENVENKLL